MTATETTGSPTPETFAGWVPTITGQLSFSLIGLGTNSSDCLTANVETYAGAAAEIPTRHVLVYQERIAHDLPIPAWLAPLARPWVKTHFILVGSSAAADRPRLDLRTENNRYRLLHDEIGVLKGKVYMVPSDQDDPEAVRRFLDTIKKRIGEIERATPRGTICGDFDLANEFELVPKAAKAAGVVFADCDFELYRSGELRLHFDPTVDTYAEAHDDAGTPDNADPDGLISGLSKQAYYFIKDISHRHFHHDASSDNILPAFRVRPGDDDGWRRDSLWSLSRAVLEHRRRNALLDHKRALGILAYAESFQAHLACVRRAADGGFEPSDAGMSFDFSHTRASLSATIDELAFEKSFGLSVVGTVLATALAAVALWIGAVQIGGSLCGSEACAAPTPPMWLGNLLVYLIEHPAFGLAIITTPLVIWAVKTQRGLAQLRVVTGAQHLLGGWAVALGASASRWLRKKHPTFGDNFGAAVAWVSTTVFVLGALFVAAGLFNLNPVWPGGWTIEAWINALAANSVVGWREST